MGLVLVLIVLALIFGGVGLLVEGLFWLLVIAAALVVGSFVMGMTRRRT